MSSFCTQPPIRLEFPTFGDSCETSDVLNFIEWCENYLDVRPLPSGELIGILSTVLKGPALSWWKAEKSKAKDWQSFKKAFMAAFLPDDYLTEVEDKLRSLVQEPRQRLRDFAYDYHSLLPQMEAGYAEDEMVSRILNNINPRVAGCLRGTVKTVEQLVEVGSKVENGGKRLLAENLAGLSIAQPQPLNSLLLVPITVKGKEVKAVLDTGSTYTLMQESLWRQLGGDTLSLTPTSPQRFIMADGKVHQATNQRTLNYKWQDKICSVDTYILKDAHLAFPLIAGLDFLRVAGALLDVAQSRYGLKTGTSYTFYPFMTSSIPGPTTTLTGENNLHNAAVTLYYALPPTWKPSLTTPIPGPVPCWDTDN
ncbi:hypothetical protein M9458_052120 [Cirrhinus mrigala]|uniref:Retrotransposon gag domain-containing protein n=1 Tax=Cirrhinus mrigala TaxID=683832 RepID=A0ABD0MUE6_CIRMR